MFHISQLFAHPAEELDCLIGESARVFALVSLVRQVFLDHLVVDDKNVAVLVSDVIGRRQHFFRQVTLNPLLGGHCDRRLWLGSFFEASLCLCIHCS